MINAKAHRELMLQGIVDFFSAKSEEEYKHQAFLMTVKAIVDKHYGPTADGKLFREDAVRLVGEARERNKTEDRV